MSEYKAPPAGFEGKIPELVRWCDQQGCTTVVFSLWSHSQTQHGPISTSELFRDTEHVKVVILGSCQRNLEQVLVFNRERREPARLVQSFWSSGQSIKIRRRLIDELDADVLGGR